MVTRICFIPSILLCINVLTSCDKNKDELTYCEIHYKITNASDYNISITEYPPYSSEKKYDINTHSIYSFSFDEKGSFGKTTSYYYYHVDSFKITFSDTFSVTSTRLNKMAKFVDIENCVIEETSKYEHEVLYTITNADYEYAKQKLEERDRHE